MKKNADNQKKLSLQVQSLINEVHSSKEELITNYLRANINESRFNFTEFMQEFEKQIIESALNLTQYNQKRASFILGLKPTTLNEKIKKHKIEIRTPEIKDMIKLIHSPTSKK